MMDRRKRGLAILALMACVALSETAQAQGTPSPASAAAWRAGGNEPSWSLTRSADRFTLATDMGAKTVSAAVPKPVRVDAVTTRYAAVADGRPLRVTVARTLCADTMSGMPHPEQVTVRFGKRTYRGCGGDPASLLKGDAWRVTKIGDRPVPPRTQVTMRFDADGRVSGKGGCNQYSAGVSLTGEGLSFQKGLSTMMACESAQMETERAFLDALETIIRFSMVDERHLVLHAADGRTTIAAERRH